MKKLNIFVSSTCYDLSQIRSDMHDFIDGSGHNPVLSEFYKFPINPSKDTISNCIDAVNNDADIFVLIIGNRYGGLIENGKSITNTEFLTAKRKGIPVYTFIDKRILSILPVWKQNKEGDFSNVVDSPKIFEFVSNIREEEKLWTFEYERAGDIINILKTQLSYLFKDSLIINTRFKNEIDEFLENNVSNLALNYILEKDTNEFYELDFLCQILKDELVKFEHLKHDSKYKILIEPKQAVHEPALVLEWMQNKTSQIVKIASSMSNLINDALREFFGEPGVPCDLQGLVYVAKTYARIFKEVTKWKIDIGCTYVPEDAEDLKNKLSNLADNLADELWDFPDNQIAYVNNIKNQILNGEEPDTLQFQLSVSMDEQAQSEFYEALERYSRTI